MSLGNFDPRLEKNAEEFVNNDLNIGELMVNTMKHNSVKISEVRNKTYFDQNNSNIMILNSITED